MNGPIRCTQPPAMPEATPGFEHISRYWDKTTGHYAAKLLPGEYYVTVRDELLVTVLGSCISACIRDPIAGVGGMNHFMLPRSSAEGQNNWANSRVSASARYGNVAMEQLINGILKLGGSRERLEVKVFGGGRVLTSMTDVGRKNIDYIQDYLRSEHLNLVAEDVGDVFPRKVRFYAKSGKAQIKKLRGMHNDTVAKRERAYRETLETVKVSGDIELF